MIILSHRGYWKTAEEKNTDVAFHRSFSLGFGTETDVRDWQGDLVISHDIPLGGELSFERFLQMYAEYDRTLPLALNVKADGLQVRMKELLARYGVKNYFVFDMSVPDGLVYLRHDIRAFTRESEYEQVPSFYEQAAGVWMDEFHGHWIQRGHVQAHLDQGKQVCLVSPDLHKRDYLEAWRHYRETLPMDTPHLMLCTDFPEEAQSFFTQP